MAARHILITGNMGYVGPAVVRQLRESFPEACLTGLDTAFFAHRLTAAKRLPESLLDRQYFADVREVTPALLEGVDAIVNLAAVSNDPMGNAFEDATMEINCRAAERLARAGREAGVRSFVVASSCSIYGAAGDAPRSEDHPVNPLTAYARSKIATENALEALASRDFLVTCLRFPTACGMSDRLRLDLVLNDFVASALARGRIDVLSDGTPWRPLIDTADMARAVEWAVTRPEAAGGCFLPVNVGREGCNYQVRELADAVATELPGTRVNINTEAQPDKRSYRVSFERFRALAPDHLPRKSLGDSIRELAAGLRAMGFSDRDFRDSHYIRLRVLSSLQSEGALDSELRWTNRRAAPRDRDALAEAP